MTTTARGGALTPITVEILGAAFSSIVEEMGTALIRASYSTNVKERRDCSTILFDAQGRTLAQAQHVPLHLGSLMGIVVEVLRRHPLEKIAPGDMFIGNDAYTGGGTHLPDIVVLAPVFYQEQLVGFVGNTSHHADFLDRGQAHIYQEGLRIPPVKIFHRGELQQDILDLILLNCQVPGERLGDLRAQFAANRLGVRRMQALCEKYGMDIVTGAGELLLDYAERQTRNGIAKIPDGTYYFEDVFDCDLIGDLELKLHVTITVKGDEIYLDFRDNPAQVRAGINLVRTGLLATTYYAIKAVVDPEILPNAGMYRPIHVDATPGTVIDCVEPAAIQQRSHIAQRVADLILGALAQAVPDQVIAACTGSLTSISFTGTDPRTGKYFSYVETIGGGFGARATKDGLDGVHTHVTNTSNLPVESLEAEHPFILERYELVQDSGGPGTWRGGMAIRREIRSLDFEAAYKGSTSRRFSQPWGLQGGHPGTSAVIKVNGEPQDPTRTGRSLLPPHTTVSVTTGGAGGYGDPTKRDRSLVARDLEDGNISRQQAIEAYGFDPDSYPSG